MDYPMITMVMIPLEEWNAFKNRHQEMFELVKKPGKKENAGIPLKYITAIEFMETVRIKRSKFDLPLGEVERFFSDRTIQ